MPTFTPLVTRDFTNVDENPVSEGGVWVRDIHSAGSNLQILGNKITPTNSGNDAGAHYTGVAFTDNQYASAILTTAGTTPDGSGPGLSLLSLDGVATQYRFSVNHAVSGFNAEICRFIGGGFVSIVTFNIPFTDGDRFYFAHQDGVLYLFDKNQVQILAASVPGTRLSGGTPGLTYSSSASTSSLDDAEFGTFVADIYAEPLRPARGGKSPFRGPYRRRGLRPTSPAESVADLNIPPVIDEQVSASRSRFGWSPSRRPMSRRNLRASKQDISIAVSTSIDLAGSVSISLLTTGALSTGIALAGASTISLLTVGALSTSIALAGASTISITTTGDLSTAIRFAAAATISITTTGALSTAITMAGAAAISLTTTGALSTAIRLAGAATISITTTGDLTVGSGMNAAVTMSITASASLSTAIALAGAASISLVTAGALSTAIQFAAAVPISITCSANLSTAIRFAGASTISITTTGVLSTAIQLAGAATVSLVCTGALSTAIRLAGAASISLICSADLKTGIPVVNLIEFRTGATPRLVLDWPASRTLIERLPSTRALHETISV